MNRLRLAVSLVIAVPLVVILSLACATVTHDPSYDGVSDPVESVLLVIENHRTTDAIAPHFILFGTGRYDLGPVGGMGGKLTRLIDVRWLGPSGCSRIVAHYAGIGDLAFDEFCWRRGEHITVTLDDIFVPAAAWSHR